MNGGKSLPSPLEGYRVLDLTGDRGFICGKILGDLGSDVIKIEPPGGDRARNQGPFFEEVSDPEKSMSWWAFNVNKRGITLNIEKREGRRLLRGLVEKADFLIESFPPGYLDSLDLGYDTLSALNPGLIMVSITPFGQTGPYSDYEASDLVLQAMGGFAYVTGDEDRPPVRIGYPNAYLHAGAEGAAAALIASYHRAVTGEGQHIDVSAQQCVVWTLMDCTATWDLNGVNIRRAGNEYKEPKPLKRRPHHWPCKDGQISYVNYGGPLFAKTSKNLYRIIEEESGETLDHLYDKEWMRQDGDTTMITQQDLDEEEAVLGPFFLRHTKDELYQWALKERIMLTPVNTPDDLLNSHQLKAREYMVQVDHPESDKGVVYPGAFVKMSETPCQINRRPPLIGEHNREIYMGELGLSRSELVLLSAAKVV